MLIEKRLIGKSFPENRWFMAILPLKCHIVNTKMASCCRITKSRACILVKMPNKCLLMLKCNKSSKQRETRLWTSESPGERFGAMDVSL